MPEQKERTIGSYELMAALDDMCLNKAVSKWIEGVCDPECMEAFHNSLCMDRYGVSTDELFEIYLNEWLNHLTIPIDKRIDAWNKSLTKNSRIKPPVFPFDIVDRHMRNMLSALDIPYQVLTHKGLQDVCMDILYGNKKKVATGRLVSGLTDIPFGNVVIRKVLPENAKGSGRGAGNFGYRFELKPDWFYEFEREKERRRKERTVC